MLEPIQKSACVASVPFVSSSGAARAKGAGGNEAAAGPTTANCYLSQDSQASRVPMHLAARRL